MSFVHDKDVVFDETFPAISDANDLITEIETLPDDSSNCSVETWAICS